MCGRIFAATDNCTALSATRGIAACAAKFKYVTSSIGNHSSFQSIDCFNVIIQLSVLGVKGGYPVSGRQTIVRLSQSPTCGLTPFLNSKYIEERPLAESPSATAICPVRLYRIDRNTFYLFKRRYDIVYAR